MPTLVSETLWNWASDIDEGTLRQAGKASRLAIIAGHIALMPDAHVGMGATVGSVIPTENAVIPSAVGVDIGCGMIAVQTTLHASQLPDNLDPFVHRLEKVIPAGVGQGHGQSSRMADAWMAINKGRVELSSRQETKAATQFGSLGSGNLTRKGAIKADVGDTGVIPGSMGTRSFIVAGKGNALSYNSCSHGAGQRYSRTKAKATFTVDDLNEQMKGKAWMSDRAAELLDEIPSAYKDIDRVMADQSDLVEIRHPLTQVLNYKGA